jgi:hypothetical protein
MPNPDNARRSLIEGLKLGPGILEDFVSGIPEGQLHRKRGEGFWSLYAQYGFKILVRHILLQASFHLYRMEELWLARDEYLTEM